MSSGDIDLGLRVLQFVLWALIGIYTWQASRHRATRDHVERVERTVQDQQRHIAVLNERLAHVPSAGEVAELTGSLRELVAELGGLKAQVTQVNLRLNRIEDFLHRRPA